MKFCVLASGSQGNCTVVGDGETRLLIDCGLSCKRIVDGLKGLGIDPASIDGICVTHDHTDHVQGLEVFHRRFPSIPFFASGGTCEALVEDLPSTEDAWNVFEPGTDFEVGGIGVHAFVTSHDAADPVGYVFTGSSGVRLGYATDLGYATVAVSRRLSGCQGLILESNHDPELLENSERGWSCIQRIGGNRGHLSNQQSATLLDQLLNEDGLKELVLAHISEECNIPGLALAMHKAVLTRHGKADVVHLRAASQNQPTDVIEI